MIRLLKNWQLDLFAIPIALNRKGKDKAISRHGILTTFLFTGFIIWIIYNSSRDLFQKKNPNTLSYESFEEVPAPLILNQETFPFAVGLQLPILQGLSTFKDEEIYYPDFKLITFRLVTAADGTIEKVREMIQLPYETCTLKHFGDSWRSFTNIPLESLYCLKPVELKLSGVEDLTEVYTLLNIGIKRCQSTTGRTCKSEAIIEEALIGSWFNMFYLQSAINPQNFSHPNQRFKTSYGSMLSPKSFKSTVIKLSHLNVIDDDGWLFETQSEKNYMRMESPMEYFDPTPNEYGILGTFAFDINQVRTTYERKYTKLQTVLAQIQGSATAVILGLVILLQPYSRMKFNETLINELFDVKIKKEKYSKKKKGKDLKASKDMKEKLEGKDGLNVRKQDTEIKEKPIETLGLSDIVFSDRALLTLKDKDKDLGERSPLPDKEEKFTSIQSFKTLLHSIENDTESPKIPYSQKAPHIFNYSSQVEIKSGRKSTKSPLKIEKPGGIKLTALSDVISDGPDSPRKISEISIREENVPQEEVMDETKPIETIIPLSPQTVLISLDIKDNDNIEEIEEVEQDEEEESSVYESSKIDISMWEYFSQFLLIKRKKQTKEKFDVLNKGMKNIRERMDVLNIMQKFRELDKLKTLLLEEDQLVLFNAIPKAEIKSDRETTVESLALNPNDERKSNTFSERILKKSTFIEIKEEQNQIRKAYNKIRLKSKKSKIDARLLEFYNDITTGQTRSSLTKIL